MAAEYKVITTLEDGTQIDSGTILIPDAIIPIANSTTLGGVMPVTKTDGMTQEVGVDSTGKLYTAPGGGGGGGGGVPTISVALNSSGSTNISLSDYNIVAANGVTAIIDTKAFPTGSNDIYYKSGDDENSIYFTCQDAISSTSSDLVTRVLQLSKTINLGYHRILKYNYYTHKTYYCNFSNNPNIQAGFYIVLDGLSQFTPSVISELYNCFGQNTTYIPIAGTYNDGTGVRPIQYLYYDGNSNSGSIYYLDSSNTLQSVDVFNESITCTLLPNN